MVITSIVLSLFWDNFFKCIQQIKMQMQMPNIQTPETAPIPIIRGSVNT